MDWPEKKLISERFGIYPEWPTLPFLTGSATAKQSPDEQGVGKVHRIISGHERIKGCLPRAARQRCNTPLPILTLLGTYAARRSMLQEGPLFVCPYCHVFKARYLCIRVITITVCHNLKERSNSIKKLLSLLHRCYRPVCPDHFEP